MKTHIHSNITFSQGKHHSGIEDCRNICKIVKKLVSDGHQFRKGAVWIGPLGNSSLIAQPTSIFGRPYTTDGVEQVSEEFVHKGDDFTKWWTSNEITLENLCRALGFKHDDVLNVYQFGSRVYKSFIEKLAHWSFVVVMTNQYKGPGNFTRGTLSSSIVVS